MLVVGDPIAAGFVTSLAQPGGNVTGATTTPGEGLAAKRLQLLKEIRPGLARVAVLWNSANPSSVAAMQEIQRAAAELGLAAGARGPRHRVTRPGPE
jgi:putative tryptophan/tyrosine transport system substrate-binding protein